MRRFRTRRQHYRDHRQPVFAGEIEVALVMGGAAENGPGAIVHQHEIGDEDRHALAGIERMDG